MVKRSICNFKRATAKQLRTNATGAEGILWRHLRRLDVKGIHFRRQVVIGNYIADFACLSERLIVEVDGSHHAEELNARHDEERTHWLQSEGYRVMRFWNNDEMSRTDAVLAAIHHAINITPPRPPLTMQGIVDAGDPPPRGEGKSERGENT